MLCQTNFGEIITAFNQNIGTFYFIQGKLNKVKIL